MTYILVGSAAAKLHIPEWREPKDMDVFTDANIDQKGFDPFWHESFASIFRPDDVRIADIDELYTIKVSHMYWDLKNGSWEKHMSDALKLKRDHGARLLVDMHNVLYKVWEEKYGKKVVDLDMDKASFFDDAVPRVYDHDSVHYSVAYGDHPLYESFLKDGEEINIDMKKVWAAPFETQVKLFREEIYATALERVVIPSNYKGSPRAAYAWALKRTVTSLTKGRSARFIADNLDRFVAPDVDYVKRHKENAHKLIKFERKNDG
jgi:hypothetical protein